MAVISIGGKSSRHQLTPSSPPSIMQVIIKLAVLAICKFTLLNQNSEICKKKKKEFSCTFSYYIVLHHEYHVIITNDGQRNRNNGMFFFIFIFCLSTRRLNNSFKIFLKGWIVPS